MPSPESHVDLRSSDGRAWMSTGEVARVMGVTPRTVRNWCARGLLYGVSLASGHLRIPTGAFEAFRDGQPREAQAQGLTTAKRAAEARRAAIAELEARIRVVSTTEEYLRLVQEKVKLELS